MVFPKSETSFQRCQNEFLVKPLHSLTEMTKDEEETGFIDFERQEKLEDITSAFKILRDYSLPELKQVDSSVVERVMLKKKCIITYFIIGEIFGFP